MATEVAVVTASTGVQTFYSTYAAARTAANANDLIQIWADLTDEQILLKDGVDIWVAPGRNIETSDSMPIILDNDGGYTDAVTMNITGYGNFINTNEKYGCVRIINGDSKISIICERLEGIGYDPESLLGVTILIENAAMFNLNCKRVSNSNHRSIYFDTLVDNINIEVETIESGDYDDGDALTIRGNGFITANEVISYGNGSCLIHKEGNIIANILKLTTKANTSESSKSTIMISDGDSNQNLTLYFDEIQNLHSEAGSAVEQTEGFLNLIGRRIYSDLGYSLDLSADADIIVNEIISSVRCINIHNRSGQIIIDADYIEGSTAETDGVVYSTGDSNFILRNMKIKNINTSGTTSPYSLGIYLDGSDTIDLQLENVILVTGDTSMDSKTIDSLIARDVKNLALFVNKPKSANITLLIGTEVTTGNYKYIESSDIT